MRRNPELPPERVDEVAIAATTQIGDQGLTIGRTAALLAGLPKTVPGYAIDRMCAGAMTAVTTAAGSIALGAYDVGDRRRRRAHGPPPDGRGRRPQPADHLREAGRPVRAGRWARPRRTCTTAYPPITKERADAFALAQPAARPPQAYADGKIQPDLVPVAIRSAERAAGAWPPPTSRRARRPRWTTLATLKTPFRPHGRVTAGNAAGLNDGATACAARRRGRRRRARPAVPDAAGRRSASPASSPR